MKKRNSATPNSPNSTEDAILFPWLCEGYDSWDDVCYDSDRETNKEEEQRDEIEETYLRQNQRYAEMALKYYNKKNRTNYELVEALASSAFNLLCLHCNFKAKLPTTNNTEDGDSSTKLFFAEFGTKTMKPHDVTRCCILKETKMKKRKSATPNSPNSTEKAKLFPWLCEGYDSWDDVCYDSDRETNKEEEERDVDKESYLHQNQRSAERALKYYNKKNHTNYELVEALASSAFNLLCLHCNFKAKPAATNNTEDGDSSTKLFFAEFGTKTMKPDDVTRCCILKGKTTAGCSLCGDNKIKHPTSSSFVRPNYRNYALRSRSRK